MIDLAHLAYPRHLHQDGSPSLIVHDADAAAVALAAGWALLPAGAEYAVVLLPVDQRPVPVVKKVKR